MNDFADWLVAEVDKRGWSFRYLGQRAQLSSAAISRVITGATLPRWEFCWRVARALNEPPETVFRRAGLLPPAPEETAVIREMTYLFSQLSPDDQQRVISFFRSFLAMPKGGAQ